MKRNFIVCNFQSTVFGRSIQEIRDGQNEQHIQGMWNAYKVLLAKLAVKVGRQIGRWVGSRQLQPKQDRQCACNVIVGRVLATIVAMEKQQVLHIVSVYLQRYVSSMQCGCAILSFMAWPAVPYFFPNFLISGTIIRKKELLNIKCVLIFSLTFA